MINYNPNPDLLAGVADSQASLQAGVKGLSAAPRSLPVSWLLRHELCPGAAGGWPNSNPRLVAMIDDYMTLVRF